MGESGPGNPKKNFFDRSSWNAKKISLPPAIPKYEGGIGPKPSPPHVCILSEQ
jgi:hypothetical protein